MSSEDAELNYSIGVLIILLLMFWFVCKSISPTPVAKEPMDSNLTYGGNNIQIANPRGLRYIHTQNKKIIVPDSRRAMGRMYGGKQYVCPKLTSLNSLKPSATQIFLNKRQNENNSKNAVPTSLTAMRGKIDSDK